MVFGEKPAERCGSICAGNKARKNRSTRVEAREAFEFSRSVLGKVLMGHAAPLCPPFPQTKSSRMRKGAFLSQFAARETCAIKAESCVVNKERRQAMAEFVARC